MPNKSGDIRVLHIIPSVAPSRGGPSKAIIEMVKALRHTGVNAEIATTNDDGPNTLDVPLNKLSQHQGVPIHFFKRFSPSISAVREFSYSYGFTRWLKKNIDRYDVIHVHAIFSYCSTYAMYLARKRKIPYVVRPIGQLEDWALEQSYGKKKRYLDLIEQRNIEGAAAVHFTADSEASQARKHFKRIYSQVIPLGVNQMPEVENAKQKMVQQWNVSARLPTIICLSRLHPKKGLELLLEAAAKLRHREFQIIMAGDGDLDYLASLIGLSKDLGIHSQCYFVGFVSGVDKAVLLQSADIFALTSYSENFGVAVLEAMSAGTVPLVTEQVALSALIKKEKLGYVSRLDEAHITAKLNRALADHDARHEMGLRAKHYVSDHYHWPGIAQKLEELYSTIVTSRSAKNISSS